MALQALRLLTDWAFAELGLGVILLEIDRRNLPSQLVAKRAGYHEAGTVEAAGAPGVGHLLFVRLASAR